MQFLNGSYICPGDPKAKISLPVNNGGAQATLTSPLTVTGNQADSVAAEGQEAILVTVTVGTPSGSASPTLTVSLQDAATAGGAYTSRGSSAAITAAGVYQFIAFLVNGFYRASWVISGTTPSFPVVISFRAVEIGANS